MLNADERVEVLREYGKDLNWFVETGTADGFTTLALVDDFDRLVTVELDYKRYLHVVVSRFFTHNNILPLFGDSAVVLKEIAHWLPEPALFWLDAHYSGGVRGKVDTPVMQELDIIGHSRENPESTILVDDARLFGTDRSYPTIDQFLGRASEHGFKGTVKDDIIRLVPGSSD